MQNDFRLLDSYLHEQGSRLDVVDMLESRQYTTLAFAAFKNHTHCFKSLLAHARRYNLPLNSDGQPTLKSLQIWANMVTDEFFTAIHFATYHNNYELIKILDEEMKADLTIKNVYGANVLHVAA